MIHTALVCRISWIAELPSSVLCFCLECFVALEFSFPAFQLQNSHIMNLFCECHGPCLSIVVFFSKSCLATRCILGNFISCLLHLCFYKIHIFIIRCLFANLQHVFHHLSLIPWWYFFIQHSENNVIIFQLSNELCIQLLSCSLLLPQTLCINFFSSYFYTNS